MQLYQGDISIIKIDSVPSEIKMEKLNKDFIVAYGEVTGHHHKLQVEERTVGNYFLGKTDKGFYLEVKNEPLTLRHQQHKEQVIEPGLYWLGQQFEYDELSKLKRVID